jgi:hypothetical protein
LFVGRGRRSVEGRKDLEKGGVEVVDDDIEGDLGSRDVEGRRREEFQSFD